MSDAAGAPADSATPADGAKPAADGAKPAADGEAKPAADGAKPAAEAKAEEPHLGHASEKFRRWHPLARFAFRRAFWLFSRRGGFFRGVTFFHEQIMERLERISRMVSHQHHPMDFFHQGLKCTFVSRGGTLFLQRCRTYCPVDISDFRVSPGTGHVTCNNSALCDRTIFINCFTNVRDQFPNFTLSEDSAPTRTDVNL